MAAPSPLGLPAVPRWRFGFDATVAVGLAVAVFGLYVASLAPTVLRSDSGEFQVVPWVLGIGHAPGYPLLTLLGRLAMLLPIGDPAYRVNLLDAAAAAAAVGCAYLAVVELAGQPLRAARVGGLAAATLGLGATYWQQAVVGGPRPPGFFFTALLLWLLFRWGNRHRRRDLVLLAAAAGLALAHHPNEVLLFPALVLYLLGRGGRSVLRPRALGPAVAAFAFPLVLYLYLPLRSAMNPPLGPLDLTDPRELLIYVTAANYQDTVFNNCGGSRLVQAQRYLELLRLQFGPVLPLVGAIGAVVTLVRNPLAGLALLYAFVANATFGICSQLAMPDYVVPSYVVAAIWIGAGAKVGVWESGRVGERVSRLPLSPSPALPLSTLAATLVVILGGYRVVTGLPYQDMGSRTADREWARAGMAQAVPNGLIISDWESITPIWYTQYVEGLNQSSKTALVTAEPRSDRWLVAAEQGLENRPVALTQRVPGIGDRYRLFPVGGLFEVSQRPVSQRGEGLGLRVEGRDLRLLGYRLDPPSAAPGELVRLTLYEQSDRGADASYLPVIRLGGERPAEFRFDGGLRYPSNQWSNNEVVGEVYEFPVPAWLAPGAVPLELAYRADGRAELVGLGGSRPWTEIGGLEVIPRRGPLLPAPPDTLANFADQLVLRGLDLSGAAASASPGSGPAQPRARAGENLGIELRWSALRWMDEGYTIFVHLLDAENRVVAQDDNLPLGGIYHTYKWVPGQVLVDWYRLPLPADLAPGPYTLEIGAYQSTTTRRLPVLDPAGGSSRTSYRWGPLRVEAR